MEVVHVYSKRRSEFGRQCLLSDRPAELLVDIPPDPSLARHFVQRSPRDRAQQACGDVSEHEVGGAPLPTYYALNALLVTWSSSSSSR